MMEYRVAKIDMDNLKMKMEKQRQVEKEKSLLELSQKQIVYCEKCKDKVGSVGDGSNRSINTNK